MMCVCVCGWRVCVRVRVRVRVFFWDPLTLSFRSEGEALHVFSRGPIPPPF